MIRKIAITLIAASGLAACAAAVAQTAPAAPAAPAARTPPRDVYADQKRVLVIADLSSGNQTAHMAVSHAVSVIEQIGRDSGRYVTFIRTDTDWITKQETWGTGAYAQGGPRQARGKNLDYFDAVVFYTNGELDLDDEQKQALLDFVAVDGKGFVGIHTATATAYEWPEYGAMLGGVFDNHPWNVSDARVIVERPEFAAMRPFENGMTLRDEHYAMRMGTFSRDNTDVLMRIDPRSVDMANPNVRRTDADFPISWIRNHGTGRVFYTGLGHTDASWDDPRIRTMMREAITWAVQGGEAARPHPMPELP